MSNPLNEGEPWEWHITETFKGLINLSIEALKALLLINGGAAVAVLAYLGNLAAKSSTLPDIKNAMLCFAGGVLTAALAFLAAYFTQLRLYYEERERHLKQPFNQRHAIGIGITTVLVLGSAIAFGVGCWKAGQIVP
jgi:hypothetical protein